MAASSAVGAPRSALPGTTGMPSDCGQLAGPDLVAEQRQRRRRRPDERDAGRGAALGERGVLGQEAVAGVDAVAAVGDGGADDGVDVEVGGDGVGRSRRSRRASVVTRVCSDRSSTGG